LTAPSREDQSAAEEVLNVVAGEKAPEVPDADTPLARQRFRDRWRGWWKDNGDKIDLAKVDLDDVGRGYTLVGLMSTARGRGAVIELDHDGRVRWRIDNLDYPVHVARPRRDRVLISEYATNRVSERDLKGNILWQRNVGTQVLSAQRLPNGHTFVASRNSLTELGRAGNTVKTITRPFDVLAAHRDKEGKTTVVTSNGTCLKLDRSGEQISSFNVGPLSSSIGFGVHFLPRGGVVVPDYIRRKVREYDAAGKLVWEASVVDSPSAVVRLSNGNTLVASRLRNRIFEINKDGREVSSQTVEGRPIFVDRR